MAQSFRQLWQQGEAANNAGNYAQAELIWRRVLQRRIRRRNRANAHYNLGIALYHQGQLAEAVESYRRAIELNPNYAPTYNNLGLALKDQGNLPEAEQAYRQAIALKPKFTFAYNNLGIVLYAQGKLTEAVESYRRAIELSPNYTGAYNNLGFVLRDQGKLTEAEQVYRQVIALSPTFAGAYNNLGLVLYNQGKLTEAVESYHRAIELNPNYAGAYNNLGNIFREQDKLTEAIQAYRQSLSLPDEKGTPTNAHTVAHNNLGYALQQQGDLQAAMAEYNKALQLDPNYAPAQNNLREAERLLEQQKTTPPPSDLAYVPRSEDEPLLYELRSTVHIIIAESTAPGAVGADYGTGWIFKREGDTIWIITNRHVIQPRGASRPSDTIEVQFFSTLDYNERPGYSATLEHITDTDPENPLALDLAVIKVEGIREDDDTIRPLKFYSGYIRRAQPVTIIGHPRLRNVYSDWNVVPGTISSSDTSGLTLDATLASGNSGSPILHAETKEVMGIVTLVVSQEVSANNNPELVTYDTVSATGFLGYGHSIEQVVNQLRRWRLIN